MLGMDIKDPELPPPSLNLGHQKELARLDKEGRERQAREREASGVLQRSERFSSEAALFSAGVVVGVVHADARERPACAPKRS